MIIQIHSLASILYSKKASFTIPKTEQTFPFLMLSLLKIYVKKEMQDASLRIFVDGLRFSDLNR